MALRNLVGRLTKPTEQLDRERLVEWCASTGCSRIGAVTPREPARLAGEVRSIRIVPRAGADALEVTISDGDALLTAVFLGRRKIVGFAPGRRVLLDGVVTVEGRRRLIYNPKYTLA